jgi:hypothetical protein
LKALDLRSSNSLPSSASRSFNNYLIINFLLSNNKRGRKNRTSTKTSSFSKQGSDDAIKTIDELEEFC